MEKSEKLEGFDAVLKKSLARPVLAPMVVRAIKAATKKWTLVEMYSEVEKLQHQQMLLEVRTGALEARRRGERGTP